MNEILVGGFALAVVLAALQGVVFSAIGKEYKPLISAAMGVGLGFIAMWGTQHPPFEPSTWLTFGIGGFMAAMTSSGAYSWIKRREKKDSDELL